MGIGKGPLESMVNRNNFWRGKRVLVTGHTGFKGAWLTLWLQKLGAEVAGYALEPPTNPNLFELARVGEGMRSIYGDVRDLDHLKVVIKETKPDIVFHLAAQALVKEAYQSPAETFAVNVLGTVNLLEAVRHSDTVRAVVAITSDKCYRNKEWVWGYRETDELGGHDPYSGSKGGAELAIASYRSSFFSGSGNGPDTVVASTRAGNVIGGGDWARDRLIPDIVMAFQSGQPVLIRNPRSTRPWQHVLMPLDGYLMLAEKLWEHGRTFAESWNFGPDDNEVKPVSWIVERMKELWGHRASWTLDGQNHPHEDTYLKLDCSKAKTRLGWTPKLNLTDTLEWIVEWYQHFYVNNGDMRQMSELQISRYESLKHELVESA